MVTGIDGGEGCSVEAWREFISRVSTRLCERILWWWSYNVKRAFSGKKVEILCGAVNAHQTYETTSYVSCKGFESERRS
jgi:hypothetical protein